MNYIKKVILENFQSHKYTEMNFDQNLNIIVGPSDQGKTAIIRGIKWALFNEPAGDFFIREGMNECSVTIEFNNKVKIKRYRSKTKNFYYLYDSNGKETIFEGFGTKVPQEIIDKISIKKIMLDDSVSNAINIGEQLESSFLLSEKSSTRANAIGRLVGVHIVDDALKDTLKDIRNLNIKKKNYEENLDKLNADLAQYDYLDELIERSNKLNKIKESIYNKNLILDNLKQKLESYKKINNEIKSLQSYIVKFDKLDNVIDISKLLTDNIKSFSYIFIRYTSYNSIVNNIEENNKLLVKLEDLDKVEDNIVTLSTLISKVNMLSKLSLQSRLIKSKISSDTNILDNLKHIENIENIIDVIATKQEYYKRINDIKIKFDDINKRTLVGEIYTEKLANIEYASNIKDSINIKYDRLKILIKYNKEYNILNKNISKSKENLVQIEGDTNNYLDKYEGILNKIEVCPFCLSPINKDKIENIISSYKKEEIL